MHIFSSRLVHVPISRRPRRSLCSVVTHICLSYIRVNALCATPGNGNNMPLTHSHTLSHTLTHTLSVSLSHTHARTHAHTHTHAHTRTHTWSDRIRLAASSESKRATSGECVPASFVMRFWANPRLPHALRRAPRLHNSTESKSSTHLPIHCIGVPNPIPGQMVRRAQSPQEGSHELPHGRAQCAHLSSPNGPSRIGCLRYWTGLYAIGRCARSLPGTAQRSRSALKANTGTASRSWTLAPLRARRTAPQILPKACPHEQRNRMRLRNRRR